MTNNNTDISPFPRPINTFVLTICVNNQAQNKHKAQYFAIICAKSVNNHHKSVPRVLTITKITSPNISKSVTNPAQYNHLFLKHTHTHLFCANKTGPNQAQ